MLVAGIALVMHHLFSEFDAAVKRTCFTSKKVQILTLVRFAGIALVYDDVC